MKLLQIWWLHIWWLIPAVLFLLAYIFVRKQHTSDWQRVISVPVLQFLTGNNLQRGSRYTEFLLASLICLALSGPSIPTTDSNSYKHSQGWIVLADVSRSMSLDDVIPSRISAMRDAALQLVEQAQAISTTLIIYAGDAFIIAPPSFDSGNFSEQVSLLEYGVVPQDGSNLTRALSLAWSVIEGSNLIDARLFILSDTGGFNNRSDAAITRLASQGHRTDLILFGSETTDNDTNFDLESAHAMARSGNGELVVASSIGKVNYQKLDLDNLNKGADFLSQTGLTTLQWSNQSHWILLFAIPLMLLTFRRVLR